MHADLAAVEHGEPEDVAVLRWARAHDLGEEAHADPHDLARLAALEGLALGGLLGAQLRVADGVHRLLHGGVIVAGVVLPAERRLVGKLLAPDEVLQAQLGRVHAELLRQNIHAALDGVGGFGDPQRAAVGHTARRLVGVDGIDHRVGDGEIVGARDDGEEAGRELGRVGAGIEAAVVGDHVCTRRPVTLPSLVAAISVVMW